MSYFENLLIALKSAITDQSFTIQIQIISHLVNCIEQSKNKKTLTHEILSTNLGPTLSDVISSQLTILMPTLKLIRHLMKDFNFRNHQFLPILKNIIRVLILLVRSERIEILQLELFEIFNYLDILLKKYLLNDCLLRNKDDMQTTFVCLLKCVELVLSSNSVDTLVKNILLEIYLHLLCLNKIHKCIFKNFDLIMKIYNLADEFLEQLIEKYRNARSELWIYKITQILLRILESLDDSDALQIRCFENIFYGPMSFVLEQLMIPNLLNSNAELFKLCISILNILLWTPALSRKFCSKILKNFVKLNADVVVLLLSKSSRKIRKCTQYSMKIFFTALIVHSADNTTNKHLVLQTFLQSRFSTSLIYLNASEVVTNSKALILLYGCSFLRHQLCDPLNANRVLENLVIILNHLEGPFYDNENWNILRIFAYCSNYAVLSALEYLGMQQVSEKLLTKACTFVSTQTIPYSIDKYIISFAKEFTSNTQIFNALILVYLSQQPTPACCKIGQIVPSSQVLPFVVSSDYNQVVNAVMILQTKNLKEEDLDFIVEQCISNLKSEEVIIEAALSLIDNNISNVSAGSAIKIYRATIAFLEIKQVSPIYNEQCYFSMMKLCVNLIMCMPNVEFKFE